ncbi:hypothetical protein B296_00051709 [Ensete ventricosum]|uniref:Uncharacterized protein n=1 Tax=Ensete ventricosum TaxID=4639 RepID=A0A426YFG7_ENSVE|nr:hypothetical protein B296_00051709 [Ensete ventricosum]
MTTAHRRRGGLQITITTNVMVTTTRTLSKSMPPFPLSSAAQHTFPMAGDEERRTRETERESDGSENEAMCSAPLVASVALPDDCSLHPRPLLDTAPVTEGLEPRTRRTY